MEPNVGASKCALGNHKWSGYIGSFTINVRVANSIIMVGVQESDRVVVHLIIVRAMEFDSEDQEIRKMRKGIEEIIV